MAIRSVVVAIYTRFPFPRLAKTPALLHTSHAGVCLCFARATKEPVFLAQDVMLRPCWTAERENVVLCIFGCCCRWFSACMLSTHLRGFPHRLE